MRVFSFLLVFSVLALSCDKEISSCTPVIISNEIYQDLDPNQVSVLEASIEDDCLYVDIGIGGCDPEHKINLITNGAFAPFDPTSYMFFDFQDENPQLCEAYFTLKRQYDLAPISELINEDIIIAFRNSAITVLYKK